MDSLEKWAEHSKELHTGAHLTTTKCLLQTRFHDAAFSFFVVVAFKDVYFWQQWDTLGLKCT